MSLELKRGSGSDTKDTLIRQLLQENSSLKSINSELNTKLSMCNSYLSNALNCVDDLKLVFALIRQEKDQNNDNN